MLRNFTPHNIVVADVLGSLHTIASEGVARVTQRAGQVREVSTLHSGARSHPNTPESTFRVADPSEYGRIEGLPLTVTSGDLLVVSSLVASRAATEAAELVDEIELLDPEIDTSPLPVGYQRSGTDSDRMMLARLERLDVLRACVAPGTGPADEPIRNDAGQIVAVTRLVRF